MPRSIEEVRAELAQRHPCDPGCPGWAIFESGLHGTEIETCDECCANLARPLYDFEVAQLPEAQEALRLALAAAPHEFVVFNDTDGVPATPEALSTAEAAELFIVAFRERFVRQGYYKTARGERIAIADVKLRVEAHPL